MNRPTDNHWISFSDIMTGLMVIFMFIAISYMMEANKKQIEIQQILDSYENTKDSIRQDLVMLLHALEEWQDFIEFDSTNLSIKFIGKDIQFRSDSDVIQSKFRQILDDFIPAYLNVIAQDKYKNKIAEVRIEGHANKVEPDSHHSYMLGVFWAQSRAKNVLKYFINSHDFDDLPKTTQDRLEFWLVANGYGYGRTLDKEGAYSISSGKEICEACSRRVEFRIITTSEQVIADIISQLK